jgi:hypothetical protein
LPLFAPTIHRGRDAACPFPTKWEGGAAEGIWETGDLLGLHRQLRLAGKLFIQGLAGLGGAKDKIEGILHLRLQR